jgi:hypothetical protein
VSSTKALVDYAENLAVTTMPSKATDFGSRRFQLHGRRQFFIRTHNKALSVAAMRVNNPDCSSLRIKG